MAWRHGTTTGYSRHRCRCDECRGAWRDYQRAYMRERYRGERRTVSTAEARRRIACLTAQGMTCQVIARTAGMDHQLVRRIADGQTKRARRFTVDKILAVTANDRPPGAMSPAHEADRLLQGILAAGVPAKTVADTMHVTASARIKRQKHVTDRTRRKLIVAYRHLARLGLVDASLLEAVNA
jgi:hypothetical protein